MSMFIAPLKNRLTATAFVLALISATAGISSAVPAAFSSSTPGFGFENDLTVLILPGGTLNEDINGGAAVVGNVGVSAGSHLDLGSGAKVGPMAGTGQVVDG